MTIVCDGKDEQPIQCYRLTGEGAKELAVGDEIAVFGTIKNYKGTIEFDKGCVLVPVDSVASVKAVIAGYALAEDAAMTSESTITGVIVAIPTAWSDEYQNITVNMVAAGSGRLCDSVLPPDRRGRERSEGRRRNHRHRHPEELQGHRRI